MWIKVLINNIVLVTFIGIKDSSASDCGQQPNNKSYTECCNGFDIIFSHSLFVKCEETECKNAKDDDQCCFLYCGSKELGLLKDDTVDSETAIASLQKLFGDDKDWIDVRYF